MRTAIPGYYVLKEALRSPLARGLAAYLVLPNLIFVLLGMEVLVNRSLINADYLLVWIAACHLPRRTVLVLYGGVFFLDLVLSTESIYYFDTQVTILAARDLIASNPLPAYPIAGVALLCALWVLLADRAPAAPQADISLRSQVLIGLAALVISGASAVRSFGYFRGHYDTHWSDAIAGSAMVELGRALTDLALSSGQDPEYRPASDAATVAMLREFSNPWRAAPRYNIVLVLVESEGLLKNAADMRRLYAPLIGPAIASRYAVKTGVLHFEGATMSGELRTLCQIYVPHPNPAELPPLQGCLPNLLRKLGYETASYHGFRAYFYERPLWYPAAGLQRRYFAEQLEPRAPAPQAHCGGFFDGVCDMWIAEQIERELLAAAKQPKFIYWLTLDSHLPIDHALAENSGFDCVHSDSLRDQDGPCGLARIHYLLNSRVARIALNSRLPPTRFILVGDHMPPFPRNSERALYDDSHVPYIELIPKAGATSEHPG